MDWIVASEQLKAPLNSAHVKTREQSKRQLSYIEGWHAIAEANRIFGFDAWQRETVQIEKVSEHQRKIGKPPYERDGWGVTYLCKVRVTVDGVTREGVGAGHGIDADLGLAHESAVKEAETDAMKRALMTFGNPFGLALYDKTQAMVTDEPLEGITGDPSAKTYKSNGNGAKAVAARNNNELYSQYEREIRAATTIEGLKEWGRLRAPELEKLPPISVEHLRDEYERQKEEIAARGP